LAALIIPVSWQNLLFIGLVGQPDLEPRFSFPWWRNDYTNFIIFMIEGYFRWLRKLH